MTLSHYFLALLLALPSIAQVPLWGQCGGANFLGSSSCVSGSSCTFITEELSECVPGAVSGSPAGGPCPAIPPSSTFTATPMLPNPFQFIGDGSLVTTKAQWDCRREEISQLLQQYELGTLPPRPDHIQSTLSNNNLNINVTNSGKSISFTVTVSLPTSGTAPFPAFIAMDGISIPRPSGVAVLTFNVDDMAQQNSAPASRGVGKFYQLYGSNHSASAMMAWAWGVSRIIDVLETTPSLPIDLTKLAVSGCSRDGKGALVAGAFEPRIALTIPQESGSGGAGCWRISDWMLANGITTQTASEIVQENVWFSLNFNPWVNNVTLLPFDHHMLAGLIAPRALLIIDNTGIDWLGPESVFGCMKTANKIWQALGVPDNMGVSQVGNHNHCAFPSSEQPDLDAFINKFLRGQSTNTSFIKTDGANDLGFTDAQWIDWSVPELV